MQRAVKIVVEKHPDGYVAYPLRVQGVVIGEGDTYEEAVADVKSALRFYEKTFDSIIPPKRSARDILNEVPGHRLFLNAEDVKHYLEEERQAWSS